MPKSDGYKNLKLGKPFTKNDPRINKKGRPRKLVNRLKLEGYTITQVNDAIQKMIAMTEEELLEVENHRRATILEITVSKALLNDMRGGHLDSISTLMDRVFGKPKQDVDVEITGSIQHVHVVPLDVDKNMMMQMVIGRVAARKNMSVAVLSKLLSNSYYANTIDAEATVIEDKPLPSTLTYNPEEMAKEQEVAKVAEQLSVEDRAKKELSEKLKALKEMSDKKNGNGLLDDILGGK